MSRKDENTLLARRFVIIAMVIAISGMALAEMIAQTGSNRTNFEIHNRTKQWESVERNAVQSDACEIRQCIFESNGPRYAVA